MTNETYNPFARIAQFTTQYFSIVTDELTNENARANYKVWGTRAKDDTILLTQWIVGASITLAGMAFESGQAFGQDFWTGFYEGDVEEDTQDDAVTVYALPGTTFAMPLALPPAAAVTVEAAIARESFKSYVLSILGYHNGYGVQTASIRVLDALSNIGGVLDRR